MAGYKGAGLRLKR
ncbi:uncharacterized protein FTOL_13472 [Fusarium torulosum]|uniref:Uncharacterized protein n=1 Tax=Fusarium torulosum TaxID=33205 RepID=A0AAE8SPV6_9HYPO|nr:uncharacterized protein FTOL_13472 [Fusarium torulosum]